MRSCCPSRDPARSKASDAAPPLTPPTRNYRTPAASTPGRSGVRCRAAASTQDGSPALLRSVVLRKGSRPLRTSGSIGRRLTARKCSVGQLLPAPNSPPIPRGSRRQVGIEWIEKAARRSEHPSLQIQGSLVGPLRGRPGNGLREQEPQDPERGIGHHEGQDDDPEHPVDIGSHVDEHEEERCHEPDHQQREGSKGPDRDHARMMSRESRSVKRATLLSSPNSRRQHSGQNTGSSPASARRSSSGFVNGARTASLYALLETPTSTREGDDLCS